MRHAIAGNKLGRNQSLRKATVRDLAKATLIHQQIRTTKAKAKEARKMVEHLITLGKKGTLAHKRLAFAILCDHTLVSNLFNKIAPRFALRKGGYTRIIPLPQNRKGDNAKMVLLELTEKEPVAPKKVRAKVAKKDEGHAATTTDTKVEIVEEKKVAPEKPHGKKRGAVPDAGKIEKKSVGGIKKMFQRKVGAE